MREKTEQGEKSPRGKRGGQGGVIRPKDKHDSTLKNEMNTEPVMDNKQTKTAKREPIPRTLSTTKNYK